MRRKGSTMNDGQRLQAHMAYAHAYGKQPAGDR
jgi:hypothetical protein